MEKIKLRKKVSLAPRFLDQNHEQHIYERLKQILSGSCTQENGYVISIDQEIDICDNEIVENGRTLCDVQFSMETLKPSKGQLLEGKVFMIFERGIFVEIQNKMKVLIPVDKILKYKYDKNNRVFVHKKSVIKQGDVVSVELELIKYDRRGFNCIGFLTT